MPGTPTQACWNLISHLQSEAQTPQLSSRFEYFAVPQGRALKFPFLCVCLMPTIFLRLSPKNPHGNQRMCNNLFKLVLLSGKMLLNTGFSLRCDFDVGDIDPNWRSCGSRVPYRKTNCRGYLGPVRLLAPRWLFSVTRVAPPLPYITSAGKGTQHHSVQFQSRPLGM